MQALLVSQHIYITDLQLAIAFSSRLNDDTCSSVTAKGVITARTRHTHSHVLYLFACMLTDTHSTYDDQTYVFFSRTHTSEPVYSL